MRKISFTGATLPKAFFEANPEGVKGGIEFGFSSTTVDRDQALHYARGKASTVFEMEMEAVVVRAPSRVPSCGLQ